MYRKIFNSLYKEKKKKKTIYDVWSYNGIICAKMKNEDEPVRFKTLQDAQIFIETANSRKFTSNVVEIHLRGSPSAQNVGVTDSTHTNNASLNTSGDDRDVM